MIIHVLGGGYGQVPLIKRIKEKGYSVLVSDKNPGAPGFLHADYISRASSFDPEAVAADAHLNSSDYFVTAGTDQPVLTAALAADKLGKPYFLKPRQALMATNKKVMKRAMTEWEIPHRAYSILKKDFDDEQLSDLTFPLVIKPLDSQGQRGIIRVHNREEIRRNFDYLLSFSREQEILAEEYYPNSKEITVSAWVDRGKSYILSLTDRVTVDMDNHLGVCIAHRYPSLCHDDWNSIEPLVDRIKDMLSLEAGPLYIQILHGERGYSVNEIACRLGGAYEDQFLPWLCGIPLLDYMIDLTSEKEYNRSLLENMDRTRVSKFLSLEMFFYKPGVLVRQQGMEHVKEMEGILGGDFLLNEGCRIVPRENSTQRAGFFIASSQSAEALESLVERAYASIKAYDSEGNSILCRF
ncbi:MAG: ATP-grasp domain-containing protein [Spirochaetales bacterium]|nr:ATP-grasp domain-containing protein [Spirochaetales bacterium]